MPIKKKEEIKEEVVEVSEVKVPKDYNYKNCAGCDRQLNVVNCTYDELNFCSIECYNDIVK